MTVTSLKIRALPAKLGSRNTISDKFTVVRGSLVVKGLQCNNWIYWVECAYTAKSGSEIHSFRCEFYDKQTKRPNIYINSTTMDFKRPLPVGNGKPTPGQELQIRARQYFLNRVSIVFAIFLVTSSSYISIHSIQFTRTFQPSTAS